MRSLYATAKNDVWAVGDKGFAAHFDGLTWTSRNYSGYTFAVSVWASGGEAWIAYNDASVTPPRFSRVQRWTAGKWTEVYKKDVAEGAVAAITGSGPTDIWAGFPGVLAHWDGATWTERPSSAKAYAALRATSKGDAWAVPFLDGVIEHFDGSSWSVVGTADKLSSIAAFGASDTWFGGAAHLLRWDGTRLADTRVPSGREEVEVAAFAGTSHDDVWAAGDETLHWDGSAWSATISIAKPISAWSAARDDVWVASGKQLAHWDGKAWTKTLDTGGHLWGASAKDVYLIEPDGGGVRHWDGSTWSLSTVPAPPKGFPTHVAGTASDDVWVAGGYDFLWVTHWNGKAWSVPTTITSTPGILRAISASRPYDVWVLSTKELLRFDGTTWNSVAVPKELSAPSEPINVRAVAPDNVYLLGSPCARWDGTKWNLLSEGLQGFDVWSTAKDVWLGGQSGIMRHAP